MGIYRGPNIVRKGLVLALDAASERSYSGSGTTWNDLADGNNGTIFGATHHDTYFTFDAASERITIPVNHFPSPTSMSMSGWFNMTAGAGTYRCVLHNGTATSVGGSSFWFGVSGANTLVATIGAGAGVGWAAGNTLIPVVYGEWVQMGATWDGSNVRVFKDGVFNKTYALATYNNQPTATTKIGASSDTGNYQVIGDIETILMYHNNALSDEEMLNNFNAQKNRFNL